MSQSKTTTRAIAASIAIVAAGATVAGAAAFQLPILGFGRAAGAVSTPPVRHAAALTRKVPARVIVKTRYVDDIVHRPAPVLSSTTGAHAPTTRSHRAVPTPATEARPSVTVTRPTSTLAVTAPNAPSGDDTHEAEHEREDNHGTVAPVPAADAGTASSSAAVDR